MNIIKEINAIKKVLVNDRPCPWLGGQRGKIYRTEDGRVVAHLDRRNAVGTAMGVVGIVPEKWAQKAENIAFDPYNDSGYASESIDLVWRALSDSSYYQEEGQKKARSGNYPPAVSRLMKPDWQ